MKNWKYLEHNIGVISEYQLKCSNTVHVCLTNLVELQQFHKNNKLNENSNQRVT